MKPVMKHIKFDTVDYELVSNMITDIRDELTITVVKGDKTIGEVVDDAPSDIISVIDENGDTTAIYKGFKQLDSARYEKNYIIYVDEDGNETTADVVTIVLVRPDTTGQRLNDLEETVDILAETILG